MTKVKIELDLTVVQAAIAAKVQPAVDAILAKYDLPALIKAELTRESMPVEEVGFSGYSMLFGRRESRAAGRPLIENLIAQEIATAAETFVKSAIAADRKRIEIAFRDMMRDAPSRLVQAFLGAIEKGINEDWTFGLKVEVEPKSPDHGCDSRDD